MEGLSRKRLHNSLTRRWLRNVFGLLVVFLLLLELLFSLMLRYYYLESVQTALESRAEVYQRTLELSNGNDSASWQTRSRELIGYFTDKDKMELQVLDASGKVLLSSTGFMPSTQAIRGKKTELSSSFALWQGRNGTGEPVMALTIPETDSDGKTVGCLRYVVSLKPVNRQIWLMSLLVLGFILFLILAVALSGSYFIRSIVRPVTAIGQTARRIALGDYDARLEKRNDDEIGALCDAVNFMAEEIATAERLKSEFISSVSHELRTPLTAIKGWSETLQTDPGDRELVSRGLEVIGKEAGRLSGLVEELLDFSHMESGHIVLRRERLDVLAELEETVFLFRERARRAGLMLEYCGADGVRPVMGDADRLRQVFTNLLDNAVKYTPAGGRVRVEAAQLPGEVQVVIGDTGVGIAPEELPRVRQKFYQTDSSYFGSGIGLAMVDEIVRLHAGRLEIDSEPGVGTTVTVCLPTG